MHILIQSHSLYYPLFEFGFTILI